MENKNSFIDTVHQIVGNGVKKGILHLYTEDEKLNGNKITIKKKQVVNFGSCSYLGLEFDERLKQSSIEAIENYGTQFSESRAYVSTGHYRQLEGLLNKLFDAYCVVAPTTTLGHFSTIPVLVNADDAIILDHQVHNSVQMAVNMVKAKGVHVEMVRHNRLDLLEQKILELRKKHRKIWYMADGIYSMYGDVSPVKQINALMDIYPELHYYVDDAHGMSCFGKHGRGYVLNECDIRDRMVVAVSFAKAFATGGAAMLFPTAELATKVRSCGGPMITSGPMQPATLGAAVASAKIHLSDEITDMQETFYKNMRYAKQMIKKYGLPMVSDTPSPIFFIAVSLPKLGYNVVKRMLDAGYYLNLGIFPAVPIKNTGIRFTITRLHTFEQIEGMIAKLAMHLGLAMAEENITMEQICQAFKMATPDEREATDAVDSVLKQTELNVEHFTSITAVGKEEWNKLLDSRGSFDWDGMKFLEDSFSGNYAPEDNWCFDYFIVRDANRKPVLATFLTTTVCKDDMLSPASVSRQIELNRLTDPYYLTSKIITLGSQLTEGEHLYIDRQSVYWKSALTLLFDEISRLQDKYEAGTVVLRDFKTDDDELDSFFADNGFFRVHMPDNHSIKPDWENGEEYLERLTARSKRHVKQDILRYLPSYTVEIVKNPNEEVIKHWYELYLNVKNHSLELNTFALPFKLFKNIAKHPNWEVMTLSVPQENGRDTKPVAVLFNYVTPTVYNFMMVGIDYTMRDEYKCYKQALYQAIMRGKALGCNQVNLGFSASLEKHKVGAKAIPTVAYMQMKDNYNMTVIANMNVLEKAGL
ncbi:MAG: aminotransferase class I/II-fold pyridoxal phosphate-dependent enzyme [Sediminibacterium sp.]|nr:aminotransferase class I/II-fold pyridoxal phosphate-dependent enzyme [Sediminibacterium sp.]